MKEEKRMKREFDSNRFGSRIVETRLHRAHRGTLFYLQMTYELFSAIWNGRLVETTVEKQR